MRLTILIFFHSNQAAILYSSSLAACFGHYFPFSAKPVRPGIKMGMESNILNEPVAG